jgi:hypothetical protein
MNHWRISAPRSIGAERVVHADHMKNAPRCAAPQPRLRARITSVSPGQSQTMPSGIVRQQLQYLADEVLDTVTE